MIIGIGVDLVDMRRIERLLEKFGERFIQRVFTKEERAYAMRSPHSLRAYTNRFAAKEAAVKALGTGIREEISWQDIEVRRAPSGAPLLYFYGKAYEKLVGHLPAGYRACLHVSFSDEPPYSTAFVILSAEVSIS
ncbi:MAG: holo-ACP synthase [Alphaproteobacteria bacterium]|nr:holo-ACP synthase [Alphaproteobacteria bacterium]